MKNNITLTESNLTEITQILDSHKSTLAYPMDSYCEDKLTDSTVYRIVHDGADIGYMGIIEDGRLCASLSTCQLMLGNFGSENFLEFFASRLAYYIDSDTKSLGLALTKIRYCYNEMLRIFPLTLHSGSTRPKAVLKRSFNRLK